MTMSDYIRGLRRKIGHALLHYPSVSVLIFDRDGRVLLVRHHEGNRWSTPGGMVEPGETPADAAVREAWEETGAHVELEALIGVFGGQHYMQTYKNGDRVAWVSSAFRARLVGGELRPDGHETLELGWFLEEEIPQLDCKPHARQVIDAAFAGGDRAVFQPPTWSPPS